MRRIVFTPKSRKMAAPTPYSRESTGNPKSSFACTVSLPSSCKLYARSLCPKPIPRPSCPRRYTITPFPSLATRCIAMSNWFPQSHRELPKISPVRHSLCTRTRTLSPSASDPPFSFPSSSRLPYTNATCSMPSVSLLYETAVNAPCSVGTRALAVRRTKTSRLRRYLTRSLIKIIFRSCFFENSRSCGRRAIVPSASSFVISHNTPAAPRPESFARSYAASVCPVLFSTPPSRYRSGKTCPGRTNSSLCAFASPSFAIVAARSPAEMPVVDAARSHDTVNAVFIASSFSLDVTMSGRFSRSAVSSSTATQSSPEVCLIMKAIDSAVMASAAPMRSPSFSRSSSSRTTTNLPAATSSSADAMVAKPGVGTSPSIWSGSRTSGCHDGTPPAVLSASSPALGVAAAADATTTRPTTRGAGVPERRKVDGARPRRAARDLALGVNARRVAFADAASDARANARAMDAAGFTTCAGMSRARASPSSASTAGRSSINWRRKRGGRLLLLLLRGARGDSLGAREARNDALRSSRRREARSRVRARKFARRVA
mmetsp:Transcript_15645/g.56193  ORF Transcript_15645/g.56193 Transcript_15645/m.56193 type:complete len:546 (+) Transcript_15645:353-1990(+)